ncbi:MAG: DUF3575 domain-containing protein [Prevotella sp.]|nr:DUF3575 domain-containing protein [Bacteroides sp.]MCM1366542.1 DUF3575 domain-containing protein [Prevotella sp.]MCM1436852.1 DUF3575 domain-containing protein [Prevotella sp.]
MKKVVLLTFLMLLVPVLMPVKAQTVGIKTNVLYDAALSPNLGVEVGIAPKWTIDLSGNFNAWTVRNHKWKHWFVQPEARYWLCERFQGNFFGFHLLGGQYNVGNIPHLKNFLGTNFSELAGHRFQGWAVGAGVAFGHAWILGKHWNLEAEIGIGWAYSRYDKYPCATCGTKEDSNRPHNYVGPTKAAVNLEYLF